MSDGSAVNHVGVWPAENSETIWLEAAAELVRASATREDGRAVCRTERTETRFSEEDAAGGAARTDAAKAETARNVNCMLPDSLEGLLVASV